MRLKKIFAFIMLFGLSIAAIFVTDMIIDPDFPWLVPLETEICVSCGEMGDAPQANMILVFDDINFEIAPVLYYNNVSADPIRQQISDAVIIVHIYNTTGFSEVRKIYTDNEGGAVFDFSSYSDSCKTYKFLYCPFCCPTEEGYPCGFQECLDFANIPSAGILTPEDVADAEGQAPLDTSLWNCENYFPAMDTVSYCPPPPLGAATPAFCLPALIIFALLGGALYLTGKNPLQMFNIGTPRVGSHLRYQARGRGMSVNIQMIIQSVQSAVSEVKGIRANKLSKEANKLKKDAKKLKAAGRLKEAAAKMNAARKKAAMATKLARAAGLRMTRGGKVSLGRRWFIYSDVKDMQKGFKAGVAALRAKRGRGRLGDLKRPSLMTGLRDLGRGLAGSVFFQTFGLGELMLRALADRDEVNRDERGRAHTEREMNKKEMEKAQDKIGLGKTFVKLKKAFKIEGGEVDIARTKLDSTGQNGTVFIKTSKGDVRVDIREGATQSMSLFTKDRIYVANPRAEGGITVESYRPQDIIDAKGRFKPPEQRTPEAVYNITPERVEQQTAAGTSVVSDKKLIGVFDGMQKTWDSVGSADFMKKVASNSDTVTALRSGTEYYKPQDPAKADYKAKIKFTGDVSTPDLAEKGGAQLVYKKDGTQEWQDSQGKRITNKEILKQCQSFAKKNFGSSSPKSLFKTVEGGISDYNKYAQKYDYANREFRQYDNIVKATEFSSKSSGFRDTAANLYKTREEFQKQVKNSILRRMSSDAQYTLSVTRPDRPIMPDEAGRMRVGQGAAARQLRAATHAEFYSNARDTGFVRDNVQRIRGGSAKEAAKNQQVQAFMRRLSNVSYDRCTSVEQTQRELKAAGLSATRKQAEQIYRARRTTESVLKDARKTLSGGTMRFPDYEKIARQGMDTSAGTRVEQNKAVEKLLDAVGGSPVGRPPVNKDEQNEARRNAAATLYGTMGKKFFKKPKGGAPKIKTLEEAAMREVDKLPTDIKAERKAAMEAVKNLERARKEREYLEKITKKKKKKK